MNAAGERCGYSFSESQALPAGAATPFAVDRGFVLDCALPASIERVVVTLLSLRGPGVPLERTDYLALSLPMVYEIRRYPPPPAGVPPSPPTTTHRW